MHNLKEASVLVVGDVMLDEYWEGDTQRISPEAPVPVVHVQKQYFKAGGAANVALNIASLEGKVKLLGMVGQDTDAEVLDKILKKHQVASHLLQSKDISTIKKLRILSQHQQLLRTDFEDNLRALNKKPLLKDFEQLLKDINVVIISDYGKGTLSVVPQLIKQAKAKNKIVLIDPKGSDFSIYRGADLVTPNLKEFEAVVGNVENEKDMAQKAQKLIKKQNFEALLVTCGAKGMYLFKKEAQAFHIPTKAREVFDVTGAGDTVISVLGMSLSAGHDLETSANLANTAAGIVVAKMGTATVSPEELHAAITERAEDEKAGVVKEATLKHLVEEAKHRGEVVVMTNGCFDILHVGHLEYLSEAKKLGDRLIVAVNTDESVRALKGQSRPLNSLQRRMQLLAALKMVDWVVPFSEDTPERLISAILPDVLVKGADYTPDQIAGAKAVVAHGGKVKTIPLTPGFSTTSLIKKIQKGDAS